jgi:hypothetical protein
VWRRAVEMDVVCFRLRLDVENELCDDELELYRRQ